MKSIQIYELCELISNASNNRQLELIKEGVETSKAFKFCLKYAYHPHKQFFLKKYPEPDETGSKGITKEFFKILDDLNSRELSGADAYDDVEAFLKTLTASTQILFVRILDKKLINNIGVRKILKAVPGLLPSFPYMRCSNIADYNINYGDEVIAQEKMDGSFVNISKENDKITLTTRSGQLYPIDEFRIDFSCLKNDYQYHGEIIVAENLKLFNRSKSNGILNHVRQGGSFEMLQVPQFYLWDKVPLEVINGESQCKTGYLKRLLSMRKDVKDSDDIVSVPSKKFDNEKELKEYYEEIISKGGEGVVVKLSNALWKNGTSQEQFKMKVVNEADVRCIGFNPGTGKNKDSFGSMVCMTDDEKVAMNVSGFTDEMREEIWDSPGDYIGSIIAIKYEFLCKGDKKTGIEYSVTSPRFVEKREDKLETDKLKDFGEVL